MVQLYALGVIPPGGQRAFVTAPVVERGHCVNSCGHRRLHGDQRSMAPKFACELFTKIAAWSLERNQSGVSRGSVSVSSLLLMTFPSRMRRSMASLTR